MKRRSREINIFNMSLLDILCGALGAFCFMMLTLFPYYTRAKAQQGGGGDTGSLQQQLDEAQKRIDKLDHQFSTAVQIWWTTPQDIDLYLWRPATPPQPEPSLAHKNTTWITGDQSTVCSMGPCSETWLLHDLSRGNAVKVYYVLADSKNDASPTLVHAIAMCGARTIDLGNVKVDREHRIVLAGMLMRTDNDDMTYTPAAAPVPPQVQRQH